MLGLRSTVTKLKFSANYPTPEVSHETSMDKHMPASLFIIYLNSPSFELMPVWKKTRITLFFEKKPNELVWINVSHVSTVNACSNCEYSVSIWYEPTLTNAKGLYRVIILLFKLFL